MEFSNKFRILKGGKISLVVSALICSVSTVPVFSLSTVDYNTTINENTSYTLNDGEKLYLSSDSSIQTVLYFHPSSSDVNLTNINFINNGTLEEIGNLRTKSYTIYSDTTLYSSDVLNNSEMNLKNNDELYGMYFQDIYDSNLTNAGTITTTNTTANSIGIRTLNISNSNISNSNIIKVTGQYGNAIGISTGNLSDGSTISNSGIINAYEAYYMNEGIQAGVLSNNSTISNSGTISIGYTYFGSSLGIKTNNILENSLVINSGTITLNGAARGSKAISVATIENSEVSNSGTINIEDSYNSSIGIETQNVINGTITNSGTIDIKNSNNNSYGNGIGILTGSLTDSNIINSGTIIIGNVYEGRGIKATDLTNSTILNSGTINVEDSYFSFGITSSNLTDSTILNSGTIIAKSQGELNNNAFSIYSTSGKILNTETGLLEGMIYLENGELINSGTIILPNADNSIEIRDGNFTQTSTGTLKIQLYNNQDKSIINFSKISVSDKVILENSSTIDIDVKTISDNQNLMIGEKLSGVIVANNGIDVDINNLNITDNSALLSFEAFLENNNQLLSLDIVQNMSISEAVGSNPVAGNAANVLDNLNNAGEEIDTFLSYLNTLETTQEITQAVSEIVPVTTFQNSLVGMQLISNTSSIVDTRQATTLGMSSGDLTFVDKNFWIKPYGSYTKQDNVGGINGFSANTSGFGIGIDGEYKTSSRIGLALFYSQTNVDTNELPQSSDLTSYNIIAYGNNKIFNYYTDIFYQIGYNIQKVNTSRYITNIGTAKADYTSYSYFASLKAVKNFKINNNFTLTPAISISYTHFNNPSYNETGVGSLNLQVNSFSSDSFKLGIENSLNYDINENTKIIGIFSLKYDFCNDSQTVSSTFEGGGSIFSTEGIKNDNLIYKTGLGIYKNIRQNLSLDLKYNLDGRGNDYINHSISIKFNYKL